MFNLILLIIAAILIKSMIKKDKDRINKAVSALPKTSNDAFIPDYTAIDFNGRTYRATQVRKGTEMEALETEDLYEFLDFLKDDVAVVFDSPKVTAKLERKMGETFINNTVDVLTLTRQLAVDVNDYRLSTVYQKLTGNDSSDLSASYMAFRVFEGLKAFAANGSLKLSANYPEPVWEESYLDPDEFRSITPKKKRDQAFPGETIAFTGRLEGMIRRKAIEMAIRHGAVYSPTLTKGVTLLVAGDKADKSLIQKASEQGTKMIPGEKFLERLNAKTE